VRTLPIMIHALELYRMRRKNISDLESRPRSDTRNKVGSPQWGMIMERKTDEFDFRRASYGRRRRRAGRIPPDRGPPAGRLPARPPPAAPGLSKIDHKLHRPYAI
jgi:hypothetical protein